MTSKRGLPNSFAASVALRCLQKLQLILPEYISILEVISMIYVHAVYVDPSVMMPLDDSKVENNKEYHNSSKSSVNTWFEECTKLKRVYNSSSLYM